MKQVRPVIAEAVALVLLPWAIFAVGPNVQRVSPHSAQDLGLVLDSPRAKTLYQAIRRVCGRVDVVQAVGRIEEGARL